LNASPDKKHIQQDLSEFNRRIAPARTLLGVSKTTGAKVPIPNAQLLSSLEEVEKRAKLPLHEKTKEFLQSFHARSEASMPSRDYG
jgi:hypothetical protein